MSLCDSGTHIRYRGTLPAKKSVWQSLAPFFQTSSNHKNLETILKIPAKLMPQLQMMIEQLDITPWLCLAVVQHLRADRGCVSWTMVVYH